MFFSFRVLLEFQGFKQILPAVDECLEGCFESQTVQRSCDTGVFFEDRAEYLLKKRRLNDNRIDLQLLSAVVAFAVPDEQSIACAFCVLCNIFKVIGVLVNPSRLASVVGLGLIKILDVSDHSWLGNRTGVIATGRPIDWAGGSVFHCHNR